MSRIEMMDFFKRCPSCGRRFVITRTAKTLVDRETEVVKEAHFAGNPSLSGKGGSVWAVTEEDVPMAYDTFRIEYTCRRCHHKWAESVTVRKRSS